MKRLARVMSLVLAISIVFGSIGFAAGYPDVASTSSYFSAVSLLSSLGIIKGYDDGTFGPDKNVTRAEFTVMLMRTMANSGLASNDTNGISFKDLDTVKDWAAGDIKTAYKLGIINGMDENTFAPDAQVTYEQALKMIVCALGYEQVALDAVGNDKSLVYPQGYLAAAYNIKLNNGMTVSEGQPAKRWEIARMLFNALEVDTMEKANYNGKDVYRKTDKNFLKDKLHIMWSTGELTSDVNSSIENKYARAGEVLILDDSASQSEVIYNTNNISTSGLVGCSIKYYYKESSSGDKTLVHIETLTKDSSVLDIKGEDIDKVTGSYDSGFVIDYWENDNDRKTTEIKTSAEPTVTINGAVKTDVTAADLLIETGDLKLIDSDNNGDYDKVNLTMYDTYVVDKFSTIDNVVSDIYRPADKAKTIVINPDDTVVDVSIKDAKTNETLQASSAFSKWAVLSVKRSTSTTRESLEVLVSKETVNGSVSSIDSDDSIVVNGKTYEFSKYFMDYDSSEFSSLKVGDSGTFYLDKDGKIAAMEKSAKVGSSYGYLANASVKMQDGKVQFKIASGTGEAVSIMGASKISIDGQSASDPDEIISRLGQVVTKYAAPDNKTFGAYINIDGNGSDVSQLIRFTKNSSGEINEIDTVAPSGDLELYDKNTSKEWTFTAGTLQFSSTDDNAATQQFKIDANTTIFVIPNDGRTSYANYSVKKYSSGVLKTGTKYQVEAYDVDASKLDTAKAILLYGGDAETKIDEDTPAAIITGISKETVGDENLTKLTLYIAGIASSNGEQTVYCENDNVAADLKIGDVIRYGTTSKGYVKEDSVQKLISVSGKEILPFDTDQTNTELDNPVFFIGSGKDANGNYDFRIVHGIVYDATDEIIRIAPTGTRTKEAVDSVVGADLQTLPVGSATKYYVYDPSNNPSDPVSQSSGMLSGLIGYLSNGTGSNDSAIAAQEVFTLEMNDYVRLVYIIKRPAN